VNAAALRDGAEDPALAARLRGGTDLQRLGRVKLRDGPRLFPSLLAIARSSVRLGAVRATP